MYTLTIDDHGADTITLHDTPAAARATLNVYLELADYDCRPAQLTAASAPTNCSPPTKTIPASLASPPSSPIPSSPPAATRTVLDAARPTALAC